MAGLDKILGKIISGADDYALEELENAKEKALDIIADADEKASKIKNQAAKEAKAEGEGILVRAQSSSKMIARDSLLGAKRELLDEVYDKAVQMLKASDPDTYRKFLSSQLKRATEEKRDEDFLIFSNKNDEDVVRELIKEYPNIKYEGNRDIDGGFVLRRKGIELNCSISSCVNSLKNEVEEEIRKNLF